MQIILICFLFFAYHHKQSAGLIESAAEQTRRRESYHKACRLNQSNFIEFRMALDYLGGRDCTRELMKIEICKDFCKSSFKLRRFYPNFK